MNYKNIVNYFNQSYRVFFKLIKKNNKLKFLIF